jgi:hypothetical protein
MLGTASSNPEIHREFIASKSKDAERMKEEMESLPAEDLIEKSMTVFPRLEDGAPFLWGYQIKGFLKETFGIMLEWDMPKMRIGEALLSKYTHKKVVDNAISVTPRKIRLNIPEGSEITHCTRPLRATTMKGDRVALATSEEVPAGTWFECDIVSRHEKLEEVVKKALDNGTIKGIGQWRGGDKGTFVWEVVE